MSSIALGADSEVQLKTNLCSLFTKVIKLSTSRASEAAVSFGVVYMWL
jgi:hypothetical protein